MIKLESFSEFNALRKNQLLVFYEQLRPLLAGCAAAAPTKYRDYYFMPQFEVGQQELVDVHHYMFIVDTCAMLDGSNDDKVLNSAQLLDRVRSVNRVLVDEILISTQRRSDYHKMMSLDDFQGHRKFSPFFLDKFMSPEFLENFAALGFQDINPKEKEINSLSQSVWYLAEFMSQNTYKMECAPVGGGGGEFEKECINEMARATLRR
jgi:hypothetical protein